jgi:putative tryptophan/tyrosine transport system substrate-binding protein
MPIGMLVDPNNPNAESDVKDMQAAAVALGRRLIIAKAGTQNDLDAAFATLVENRVAALFVTPKREFPNLAQSPIGAGRTTQLPSSYSNGDFVRAGGLMSYGPDQADVYRLAGLYAGRILKGEKPAELPVMQPTKFDFVLNLKTAKALGLTIPKSLLLQATEVIE